MPNFHVIIPAAGIGNRMATALPKQYMPILGKPMISHSVQTFFALSAHCKYSLGATP